MRKRNEGYVLIYVLVVMVVMGLVATGALTVSLNNYRAQQAAGQRMQELYEAEGIAEQLVAEISVQSGELLFVQKNSEGVPLLDEEGKPILDPINLSECDDASDVNRSTLIAAADDFVSKIESLSEGKKTVDLIESDNPEAMEETWQLETVKAEFETYSGTTSTHTIILPFSLITESTKENARVEAQLEITIELSLATEKKPSEENIEETWLNGALAKVIKVEYESYEISTGVGA